MSGGVQLYFCFHVRGRRFSVAVDGVEPTFADAILDRIVHNAYRLELDGPSMRKIKAAEPGAAVPQSDPPDATSANVTPTKSVKGAKK